MDKKGRFKNYQIKNLKAACCNNVVLYVGVNRLIVSIKQISCLLKKQVNKQHPNNFNQNLNLNWLATS